MKSQPTLFKKDLNKINNDDITKFINEEGSFVSAGMVSDPSISNALGVALEVYRDSDGMRYYPTPDEVLDVFKSVTGKTRTRVDTYERSINARIVEGYSLLDFTSSILRCFFAWKGTKMDQYIRLNTILAPKHFSDYVSSYKLTDDVSQFYMSYALQALNKANLFELLTPQELSLCDGHYHSNKGVQFKFTTVEKYRSIVLNAHRAGLDRYERQMILVMDTVRNY